MVPALLDRFGHDVHVCLRVDPTRDREPHQLQLGVVVLAGHLIAARRDDAAFHRADARLEVELRGEHLGGELLLVEMRVEAAGVQEDAVPADGLHEGDVPLIQQHAQVAHLADA